MRLAVLSDIHGNLAALEAVLADAESQAIDGILVAGDLSFGPQTGEITRRLRALGSWMIRGNNEDHLIALDATDGRHPQYASRQWACMRWQYAHLDTETRAYMTSLPEQRVLALPGTAPIRNGRLALNPGSVGAPLNDDPRAQYALLTWREGRWQAEHRAIPYDLGQVQRAFQESGLLEAGGAFARAMLLWVQSGHDVTGRLLSHAYRLAAQEGYADCAFVPDEVWERAAESFDWAGRPATSHSQE